jgi:hypothetical protein
MTNGSSHCGWWPVWLTVLGHSKIQIDMRDHGRVAACGASGARVPIAVWINPQSLAVHRPLTVEFTYKEGAKQWHRTIVVQGIRAGRP